MNKYQIALNSFVECANEKTCGMTTYESIFGESESVEIMENSLQELVDKETPMKPKFENIEHWENVSHCKNCELILIGKFRYCGSCGQKIDWSEDEESQPH